MVEEAGAILYTVEIAFGDRAFSVTSATNPHHLQLRTSSELWYKENAINLGVARLPADWQRVAWVDSDVTFARDDWANETLHRLQHYDFIQMWSQFQDMTTEHESVGSAHSFMDGYLTGWRDWQRPTQVREYHGGYPSLGGKQYPGAPGLAWACTRRGWETVGGLIDFSPLGAGDWMMAWALVGLLSDQIVQKKWHPRYRQMLYHWRDRAVGVKKNVGVMPGLALHHFHGPKLRRRYATREQILAHTQFNPDTDLQRDWQGLWQLRVFDERTIQLRDQVRAYFHQRQEDQLSPPRD